MSGGKGKGDKRCVGTFWDGVISVSRMNMKTNNREYQGIEIGVDGTRVEMLGGFFASKNAGDMINSILGGVVFRAKYQFYVLI